MVRLEFLVCVVVMCTLIGGTRAQCDPPNCTLSDFGAGTSIDPDMIPEPDQECYAEGTDLTLTCAGEYGGPEPPFTCNAGSWGPPSPSCDLWYCDPPSVPVESDVTVAPEKANYTAGDVVTYGCPPGQNIIGASAASCDNNGWNPAPIPTCLASCDVPVIANGNLTSPGPFNGGDSTTVECYPGYEISTGTSTITCGSDGNWDAIPQCFARCTVPGVPNSNTPTSVDIGNGETRTITCDIGYSSNQQTAFPVTCTEGTLGGTVPSQCYQNCAPLTAHADGSVTGEILHGQTATYTCDRGFMLNETDTETCNDGVWSNAGTTPTCYDQSLADSIRLICEPGYFIVEIPLGLFSDGSDESSVVMGGCSGTGIVEDYIFLNSTYNDCGTVLTVASASESKLIYSNTVTNADTGGAIVTVDSALTINIQCRFDQDNLVSSSAIMQNSVTNDFVSDSQYSLTFGAWEDASYMTPITALSTVNTNTDIFLKAQVNNILLLDVFPTTCYATPTAAINDTTYFELISAGESVNSEYATALSEDNVDDKPTFSFQSVAFRFTGHASSIFIHCDLKICPDGTCPLPVSARRRRSINDAQLTVCKHVLAGPIKIREAREADAADDPSAWQTTALTVYSTALSVFAVCSIGFVGVFMYRQRLFDNLTLAVPRTRLKTFGDRAFSSAGPVLWNDLPVFIRNAPSLSQFKSQLKTHYFRLAFP